MITSRFKNVLSALALASAIGLTGCLNDSDPKENPGSGDTTYVYDTLKISDTSNYYTVGVRAGTQNYLLSFDNLASGSVTPVGNGLEVSGSGDFALQSGNYIYDYTRSTKFFTQYELKAGGKVEKKFDILGTPYMADRAYSKNLIDDSTLLYIDPIAWGKPEMKWVTIRIPQFTVKAFGSFTLPIDTAAWRVNVGRAVVVGNKLFMGTVNYNATATVFRPGAFAYVFDYPSMTNPTLVSTTKANAELGITATANMFKTENGDLYFAGSAGKVWGNLDTSKNHGVILRIKSGETQFDTSYVFNISTALGGEKTNIMQINYAGNNTAVAVLFKDADVADFAGLDGDVYTFAKVDLSAKTVVKYDVAKSASRLGRFPLIKGGKYYNFMKSVLLGTSRIVEIDIAGGASTLGATVSGSGVTGYGLYAHPSKITVRDSLVVVDTVVVAD